MEAVEDQEKETINISEASRAEGGNWLEMRL